MKKYSFFIMALMATSALMLSSCKDDNEILSNETNTERLFMPMFRLSQNVGVDDNGNNVLSQDDPYGCGRADFFENAPSNFCNDIWLNWYEVDGAVGYQLTAMVQGGRWENPEDIILDVTLPAGTSSYLHEDLDYGLGYLYSIRALSPKGELYHSKWFGRAAGNGDLSHQGDMSRDVGSGIDKSWEGSLNTGERYTDYPQPFYVTDVTTNSLRVNFNHEVGTDADAETARTTYKSFFEAGAEIEKDDNGIWYWKFDQIVLQPTSKGNTEAITYNVKPEDKNNRYVDFTGLVSNEQYIVMGLNNGVKRSADRNYGKLTARIHGEKGEPIYILPEGDSSKHLDGDSLFTQAYVPELAVNADEYTRLDTVLVNYMDDNNIAEGQIFYLKGGKKYYTQQNIEITKGFTLATDPEDVKQGKRATVLLGLGYTTEAKVAGKSNNFMLSRNARNSTENGMQFTIDDVVFQDINFSVDQFNTYTDRNATDGDSKLTVSANYFMNMYSQGLSFSLNKLEVSNCTFSGMIRGFIRFQGPNRQIIGNMTVDNCVFYDCGNYDNNGRGYAWFAGPGNQKNSNFFQDVHFTNNTIIDCPRHALFTESGNMAWPKGTKWNIVVENNTFVNFSPRSNNKGHGLIFEITYAPSGSKVTCKKNLFVWTRKGDKNTDNRTFYNKGMLCNTGNMTYDFADNYSTVVPEWGDYMASNSPYGTTLADGMFTHRPFSDDVEGAARDGGQHNVGGLEETMIKFGDNYNGNEDDAVGYQLTAEELFKDPQPLGVNGTKDMHRHNIDGFYYNNTDRVKNHPIYTKQIGDQRWATGKAWK